MQLWSGTAVEIMSGTSFSPETKKILTLLAEGVYSILIYSGNVINVH